MNAPDRDDETWRITFVRLLLCILLVYYLATIVIVGLLRPGVLSLRELSPVFALLVCFSFAAIALTRLRGEAIIAVATAALISIWLLDQALFRTPVLGAVFSRSSNWRIDVAVLILLAACLLPTVAFFVALPLRPRLVTTYSERAEPTEDSQAAPANPPVVPPE